MGIRVLCVLLIYVVMHYSWSWCTMHSSTYNLLRNVSWIFGFLAAVQNWKVHFSAFQLFHSSFAFDSISESAIRVVRTCSNEKRLLSFTNDSRRVTRRGTRHCQMVSLLHQCLNIYIAHITYCDEIWQRFSSKCFVACHVGGLEFIIDSWLSLSVDFRVCMMHKCE